MIYLLRMIVAVLTLSVLIGGLFLIFMRDNEEKSSLWLAGSLQEGHKHPSAYHLDRALFYDRYNAELWWLTQTDYYKRPEHPAFDKAKSISRILEIPHIPASPVGEVQ